MNESNADTARPAAAPAPVAVPPQEPGGRGAREPSAGAWRMPVTLALRCLSVTLPYFSKLLVLPSAQSADWGTA
jgi:hypothetical protein